MPRSLLRRDDQNASTYLKSQPSHGDEPLSHQAWTAKVVTLYPEMFPGTLNYSVVGRALRKGIWSLEILNLRNFGVGKHKNVDDTPSGGGPGMILRPDVVDNAITSATESVDLQNANWPIINLAPQGQPLTQKVTQELSKMNGIIILCGRFEGVDQRVIEKWNMWEISLGDFILSGGEIAAQALIDSTVRNLPKVLGNSRSAKNESFSYGLLEYPQYTKPSNWKGRKVPDVLLSGNHVKVQDWQNKKSIELTKHRRPDLLLSSKKNRDL